MSVPTTPVASDIVAIVAHPDDAELHCGGTLALAARRGHRTAVVDLTRGELSTRGTPRTRAEEAAAAAEILGLSCRLNLGLPDGHVRDDDATRAAVVRVLRELRPSVVISPPLDDHHADHMGTATVVDRAFYLAGVARYVPELPPWRPASLLRYVGTRDARAEIVVDISEVIDVRMRALRAFASQLWRADAEEAPTRLASEELLEWITGALRRWGFLIGASYGEAFTSPDPIPISDPVAVFGRGKWEAR